MKKLMLVVMFSVMTIFMLVGCSGPRINYNKPGGTIAEFNRDKYACVQQSQQSWSAGGSGAAGGLMIIGAQADANNRAQQLFRMCMEARGYIAQIEAELTDEEQNRQNIYKIKATEFNQELQNICNKLGYGPLFKKAACKVEGITFEQLTDKSFPSAEEKALLLKWQSVLKDISEKRNKLVELAVNPVNKKNGAVLNELDAKIIINDLNLYEGKICWGDYNKTRKDDYQVMLNERKNIR